MTARLAWWRRMRWGRAGEMTCQELVELVTEYLEETLPGRDRARFERHLAGCPYCTNYLDQMRITIRVLGRLPEESLEPAARDALLDAFQDWKRERA
jgi:anti-sigma factor RsiW